MGKGWIRPQNPWKVMRVQEVQGDTYLCVFWFRERRGGHTRKNEKSNEVLTDMDLVRTRR